MIDLVCVDCGYPLAAHNMGRWCPVPGLGEIRASVLIDSHALDDVPPARRALERTRLAQMKHDRRVDVQLGLSTDAAFG